MKKLLLFALGAFAILPGECQTVDSLAVNRQLDRADLLYQMSYALIKTDSKKALVYSLEGYNISVRHRDSLRIVRMGLVYASALRHMQKFDSAVLIYSRIYTIAKKNNYINELAFVSNGFGISYTFLAQYDRALQYYFESWEIRKTSGPEIEAIRLMINIGVVYYKLKNYKLALEWYLKCHEMQKDTKHFIDTDLLMINIGNAYVYQERYGEALDYFKNGLAVCQGGCPKNRLMEATFGKGIAYFGLGDFRLAERFFLESYHLSKALNDARFQVDNIDYLSQLYLRDGRPHTAARYLIAGEAVLKSYPSFNLEKIKLYSRFSDLYRNVKEYKKASDYQLLYMALRDSVYSEQLTNNLMRVQAEYREKENLGRIAAQEEVIALNNRIIQRTAQMNTLLIVTAAVSAGLIVMILRSYLLKKKANVLLDAKIEERTRALLLNNERLRKSVADHEFMLSRTVSSYTRYLGAIEGLCVTGLKEVSDSLGRTYMLEIEGVTRQARRLSDTRFD